MTGVENPDENTEFASSPDVIEDVRGEVQHKCESVQWQPTNREHNNQGKNHLDNLKHIKLPAMHKQTKGIQTTKHRRKHKSLVLLQNRLGKRLNSSKNKSPFVSIGE